MNEASDIERRLIVLREPAQRKKEGDRAAALRPCCVADSELTGNHRRCNINQRQEDGVVPYFDIIWNPEPGGNVEHIAEHDLRPEDVEEVIFNPVDRDFSRSSGLPILFGFAPDGRYILVVYEKLDDTTVYPVTAFDVKE